jgi:gluconokinase
MPFQQPPAIKRYVIMGVAGSGKTSVGRLLGEAIGATYLDGDDLHPHNNIAKMARGEPLTDADRAPWLDQIGAVLAEARGPLIVGCSALKRRYRDQIRASVDGPVTFLYLDGSRDLIAGRMALRAGHFMPMSLLDSQFAALEPPAPDEDAITVSIDADLQTIVARLATAVAGRQ